MPTITYSRQDPDGVATPTTSVNRRTVPMRAVLKQVGGTFVVDTDEVSGISSAIDPTLAFNRNAFNPLVGRQSNAAKFVEFPFGPLDVRYQGLTNDYAQIRRPAYKPLLVRTTGKLRVVTFTAFLADKRSGGKETIEETIETLYDMSVEDFDCEFVYGLSALPYRVRITQMDVNSRYRNLEGLLTQANVSVQLTERVPFDPLLGDLSAVTPVGTLGKVARPQNVVGEDETDNPQDELLDGNLEQVLIAANEIGS